MPHFLDQSLFFPPSSEADTDGLLAIGGDLSPNRLMLAYRSGIFPWFDENDPILWWSPNPRMVLLFEDLIISKSMRNILNRKQFDVTYNQDFRQVITNCQKAKRKGQHGTWITDEMIAAYCELHQRGHAKSVEVWHNRQLVGGLYGIDLGHVFCGESMFSTISNASKVAFISLARKLESENYKLLDCQLHNNHLESLGCKEVTRHYFESILKQSSLLL